MSPEFTIHASYEHRFDLGTLGSLVPQIDVQYKTDYILSFDRAGDEVVFGGVHPQYYNYPWNYQEAHYMLNGSLLFNHASDIWSLRTYVKNATNYAAKNAYGGHFDIKLGLSDPRTYGAVLSVKF